MSDVERVLAIAERLSALRADLERLDRDAHAIDPLCLGEQLAAASAALDVVRERVAQRLGIEILTERGR